MKINLTRKQELHLINLGLEKLFHSLIVKPKKQVKQQSTTEKKKYQWSEARRRKFSNYMKKKWAAEKGK